jgi:hypothetical protein
MYAFLSTTGVNIHSLLVIAIELRVVPSADMGRLDEDLWLKIMSVIN